MAYEEKTTSLLLFGIVTAIFGKNTKKIQHFYRPCLLDLAKGFTFYIKHHHLLRI